MLGSVDVPFQKASIEPGLLRFQEGHRHRRLLLSLLKTPTILPEGCLDRQDEGCLDRQDKVAHVTAPRYTCPVTEREP
jgi:hypothetical protein